MLNSHRIAGCSDGPDRSDHRPLQHSNFEWLVRAGLLVAAVIALHLLEWNGLRYWTSEAVLRLSNLLALPMYRVSHDVVSLHAQLFNYTVSCTFIDVLCGVIPLTWNRGRSAVSNLLTMAGFASGLFVFNILRLTLGFLLYGHGVPWAIGHEAMSGVAYFMVWLWLMRQLDDPIARYIERLPSRRGLAAQYKLTSGDNLKRAASEIEEVVA
jgi:hypothetical protein